MSKEMVEFDKIAAGIAEIQSQGNFLPDMTTKKGYEASKRFVLDVTTPTRTKLDVVHKKAKAYWIAGGQSIDKQKNEILDLLVDIQKPHQEAYKAVDQKKKDEKARFAAELDAKVQQLFDFRNKAIGKTSTEITDLIDSCGEIDTEEGFYTRANDAFIARRDSLELLNDALMSAIQAEAEAIKQAELAEQQRLQQIEFDKQQEAMRLQQEAMQRQQAEIDAKAEEQRQQLQAIEDEKQAIINAKESEQRAIELDKQRQIDELARIEREKQQAIEREAYAKQQSEIAVENARIAELERQRIEQERLDAEQAKLEANKAHVGRICKQAKEFIMSFDVDEKTAVKIVKAIGNRSEETLTLNY
jgi:hypothetical protein